MRNTKRVVVVSILMAFESANAFIPGPPRSVATGGKSHKGITESALDEIYVAYGYGPKGAKPYTRPMKKAIDAIAEWNAWVDYHRDTDPFFHCDGERINECSNLVKSEVDAGITALKLDDVESARQQIGMAFHTLQDFYSHSNWIELGHHSPNAEMGTGPVNGIASRLTNTCINAPIANFCFTGNIITTDITSGYFLGTSGAPAKGVRKCYHGGSFDGLGRDGINKDSTTCILGIPGASVVSPHSDSNPVAEFVATQATLDTLNNVKRYVTDKQFKAFLGIGPSLGFAIDTTGSMGSVINGVKTQVMSIIDSRQGTLDEPSRYILSPFNDPSTGPVTTTSDPLTFKSQVSGLFASGGDDCPELAMAGVYGAVAASDNGGDVFFYTDASAKDSASFGSVLALAQSKQVRINAALFGSCSPYDPTYFKLAEQTGGQVFILNRAEAGAITKVAGMLAKSSAVDIAAVSGSLSSSVLTQKFIVDPSLSNITVSVSISGAGDIELYRPDGRLVNNTDVDVTVVSMSSAILYSLKNPMEGEWQANVKGSGTYSLNVSGESYLAFNSFKFVQEGGRAGHTGLYEINGRPLLGQTQTVLADISGAPQTVRFEFRSRSGEIIQAFTLPEIGNNNSELSGQVSLPNQSFVVYAFGSDASGKNFERVIGKQVLPQSLAIIPPSPIDLGVDQDTTYIFQVTNNGDGDMLLFSAKDDKNYVSSVTPNSAMVNNGENVKVKVVVHPTLSARRNTLDTLSFTAQSTYSQDIINSAVLVSQIVPPIQRGDVNHDGFIDCEDISLVKVSFGKRVGQPAFNPAVDIDNNGIVDIRDLSYVAKLVPAGTRCIQ